MGQKWEFDVEGGLRLREGGMRFFWWVKKGVDIFFRVKESGYSRVDFF